MAARLRTHDGRGPGWSHVAAGRTYREIARTLVVSEKTVSVHISNMLRKTGTANRIELAHLAHRVTTPPMDT
jgi:DNA-binding NarL/FixJ family response regulator